MAVVTLGLWAISGGLRFTEILVLPNNLSFYMVIVIIFMCLTNLYTQIGLSGIKNPDHLISFFIALTIFFASACLIVVDH
jgi:hypothetical protein